MLPGGCSKHSPEGRTEYLILFPTVGANSALLNPAPPPSFQRLPPNQVHVRGGADLASSALIASGARRVESRELRMSDGDSNSGTPPTKTARLAHGRPLGPQRGWIFGCVPAHPACPGLRRAREREILDVSAYPGRTGYPASMTTDARIRCSIEGYQSSCLASQSCGARPSLPVRPEGRATSGDGAGERQLARRAEMGFRPSYPRLTHTGAPPSYLLRPFGPLEGARGATLAKYGP